MVSVPATAGPGPHPGRWTEAQQRFSENIVSFAAEELHDVASQRDSRFPTAAWERCAAFGIQGLPVPQAYGGRGADPETIALGMEALGYACRDNGILFSLGAHMWSCEHPLVRFGTEEQKRRYLPALVDGSMIGVQAITEPDAGSDPFGMNTTATPSGDHWLLNGAKTFITNAPVADLFVAFATTDREAGFAGACAFLVERDTPGLAVGQPMGKMGLHSSPTAEITFTDCRVPHAAMLGAQGAGLAVFASSMDWERTFILAPAVGTMQYQLEKCVAYARARHQSGQPIGKFQSVANRIVDMKLRLETSRLLLYEGARMIRATSRPGVLESSMLKLHISECFLQSSLDAVQIHGGVGYTSDLGLECDVRDAVAGRIYSGTSEIQRNLIARRLGL